MIMEEKAVLVVSILVLHVFLMLYVLHVLGLIELHLAVTAIQGFSYLIITIMIVHNAKINAKNAKQQTVIVPNVQEKIDSKHLLVCVYRDISFLKPIQIIQEIAKDVNTIVNLVKILLMIVWLVIQVILQE